MSIEATSAEQLIGLAKASGLIRARMAKAAGLPHSVLARLVQAGELERVERGLYRLTNTELSAHQNLEIVALKAPQAVFCLLSALQFHGLTTQIPRQIWIAMPRGSHTPKLVYPPLKMVQFEDGTYAAGVEKHSEENVELRVYSVAKTITDCFKHRNKIGLDIALEALRDARAQNKASLNDIWHHAKINRVAVVMRPYLEAIA